MPVRSPKAYYSESEAARTLGISIEEFRGLIRRHIVETEEDLHNCPKTTFCPADLLLLKLLSGRPTVAIAPH